MSNRLRIARSMVSGRLVAPNTKTGRSDLAAPSISVSNCVTMSLVKLSSFSDPRLLRDPVEFVDEENGRRRGSSLVKRRSHGLAGCSGVAFLEVGHVGDHEVDAAFVGNRPCNLGLARAWRAVEQDVGDVDALLLVLLCVLQDLAGGLELVLDLRGKHQRSHVFVSSLIFASAPRTALTAAFQCFSSG